MGTHRTGHYEAVRVIYDPSRVTFDQLLDLFWHNIDPTQADGQFCDRGPPYRTAIFVSGAEQRAEAEASRRAIARRLDARVVTEILERAPFWVAEAYHQDYYRTHPERYRSYRQGCGRDRRLRELWGTQGSH
jgi:peptide-methionine (S)-S-oxide reductase